METIEKLKFIEDTWRNYIWNYDFFRGKLNFNDELKTNYVGVIFGYLNDTIPIFEKTRISDFSLESRFINSIGILQLIYIQQDLISELNKSFGLPDKIDFGKNREIRNEIAGHPISRNRDKTLKSFCLFGFHPSELGDITYLKYHKDNNFKYQASGYFTKEVIENHFLMLNENFDHILEKIKHLFSEFKSKLIFILENIESLDFKDLIIKVKEDFNNFLDSNKVFQFEKILKCYEQLEIHKRYEYNVNLFLSELKGNLLETINNINQEYLNKNEIISVNEFIDLPCNYTFGKLYENHPVFGIDYFKKRFSNDRIIIEELQNMEYNIGNDFEYHCSYNYLNHLININHPDFFNE